MKILFVVPYAPNLVRVRPYNLIRALSEKGNQVTVCTLYSNSQERLEANNLDQVCQSVSTHSLSKWQSLLNCLLALPSSLPLQAVYSWIPSFAVEIKKLCYSRDGKSQFDIIHVEHLRGSKYGTFLKHAIEGYANKIPIVWDSVDCISLLFRLAVSQTKGIKRWITAFELPRTEKYESHLLGEFSHICVTSKNDRVALGKLAVPGQAPAEIHVIPNGVDLDYFTPGQKEMREQNTLVVSGKMSYHANISMVLYLAREIMPHIWSQCPKARLKIVGKDPTREIRALAQNPLIQVVGEVPDMRPYLQQASIALTPIQYGVGIQNKVLEAMACGTPVISTSQAVSALDILPGQNILVEDTPLGYAQTVCKLLQDPQRQVQVGQAGRAYVEKHHNWQSIAQKLEEVYSQAEESGKYHANL